MSALDDLVQALQAVVSSVDSSLHDRAQAESSGGDARQAAEAFGQGESVAHAEALRGEIADANASLSAVRDKYEELLQQAVALQQGRG